MDTFDQPEFSSSPAPKTSPPWFKLLIIGLALVIVAIGAFLALHPQKRPSAPAATVPTQPAGIAEISITDSGFNPKVLKVKRGTQVMWINKTNKTRQVASDPHPTHSSVKGFNNDVTLEAGDSVSFQFETVGTYGFHDHLNPYEFSLKVEVVD